MAAPVPPTPHYAYRLSNNVISRHVQQLLSIAVSTAWDAARLHSLLESRQASGSGPGARTPVRRGPAPLTGSGDIEAAQWNSFRYILPRIVCPEFLQCPQVEPLARTNEPLVWDWPISATKWDAFRSGYIFVKFYGDNDVNGRFSQEIAAIPPIVAEVETYRDMTWWETQLEKLHKLLDAIHADLIGAAAIIALIATWIVKLIRAVFPRRPARSARPATSRDD